MLRVSKLTDYGTVILAHMARQPAATHTAADVAAATHIAQPTVSKLLKLLSKGKLLTSTRGAHGGYSLAYKPEQITAVQIIDAIEGPVALTECAGDHSQCGIESVCAVGHNWQRINIAIRDALKGVTLAQLAKPTLMPLPVVTINPAQIGRPRTVN